MCSRFSHTGDGGGHKLVRGLVDVIVDAHLGGDLEEGAVDGAHLRGSLCAWFLVL